MRRHRVMAATAAGLMLGSPLFVAAPASPTSTADSAEEVWLSRIDGGHLSRTNADGDSAVAFERDGNVYVRTRPAGRSWGKSRRAAADTELVGLTINGAGRPTVAWRDRRVKLRTLTRRGWTRPWVLPHSATTADVEMVQNTEGALVVLYRTAGGLRATYRRASGAWRAPQTLFRGETQPLSLRVGIDRRGRATAVWTRARVGEDWIYTARSGPRGAFKRARVLSSLSRDASYPDLTLNAAGAAAVGWVQRAAEGTVTLVRTRTPDGTWGSAERVGAGEPHLAIGPRGGLWAVWLSRGTDQSMMVLMSRKGARADTWTEPAALLAPEGVYSVDVDASHAGSALVTYRAATTTDGGWGSVSLWYSHAPRFRDAFSEPEQVPHSDLGHRVSMSATGHALMTVTSRLGPGSMRAAAGPDPVTHLFAVSVETRPAGTR